MGTKLSSPLLCVGHRGASGYEPENTLKSLHRAIDLGCRWIEFDIQKVEQEIILFHDRNLRRRTGFAGETSKQSLAFLDTLDAGNGEKIPLLSQVLPSLRGKVGINVEIKGENCAEILAARLLEAVHKGWDASKIVVSSFDHYQLAFFQRLAPVIRVALLIKGNPMNAIESARAVNALSINTDLEFMTKSRVDEIHAAGLRVFVYVVNDPQDISLMRDYGVDGIFSDFPDRAL